MLRKSIKKEIQKSLAQIGYRQKKVKPTKKGKC